MNDHPLLVPDRMLHPPGIVGVPSGEQGRWADFTMCLSVLWKPKGTRLSFVKGTYIQASRNELVLGLLETDAQWLFMVDDDHTFEPSLLIDLLDRYKPVVGATAVMRKPPFGICAYALDANHQMGLLDYRAELMEVAAVGTGAILIRREVFEALDPPWFQVGYNEDGRLVSEDVGFCHRAREAGYQVYLDGRAIVKHLTGVAISVNELGLQIDLDHEKNIVIPKEQIDERVEEVSDAAVG